MKKTKEFDNILDECLERVLFKGETVEQCLASYPEQAVELEPLLQTALSTKQAIAIKPRPEFRDRARYQFDSALREMEIKRERRFFFGWRPQWVTTVSVVLILLLGSSGTVAAASNSMPDEPLYPVKLATETVRMTLTPSTLGKAELYIRLADKRVAEIVKMAAKGKPEQVEQAAQRLNEQLIAMAVLVTPSKPEAAVFMAPAPQAAPEPPVEKEPQEKGPAKFRTPGPPRAAQEAPVSPGQARGGGGGKGGADAEDKGGKVDKWSELRSNAARSAAEHSANLRAVLKGAPKSVKPALRQAIAVLDTGYEEALRALD